MKKVTINADDFGLNSSCTAAICQAFEQGLITDTTMVANGEAFEAAVGDIEKYHIENKIGIHFNLTEGKPLTTAITQCPTFVSDGQFHGHIDRLKSLSKAEKKAVYEEFTAQIKRLETAGIKVIHADSHHHIHTGIFIAPIFARVCKEHGISKVRLHRNIGTIPTYKKWIKAIYNKWLRNKGFTTTEFFGSMEDVEKVGVCDNLEIMVHPEFDPQGVLIDKIDEVDGGAVGKELARPAGEYHLRGYKDL
jgi:hypothetical protein